MAPTGTLIPAQIDMEAVAGADFQATVQMFSDVQSSVPFDLTGYTVTVTFGSGLVLSAGLSVTPLTGTVQINLTSAQTAALVNPQHYYMELVDAGGTISFPLAGSLFIIQP